jgi:hypothetical protein
VDCGHSRFARPVIPIPEKQSFPAEPDTNNRSIPRYRW